MRFLKRIRLAWAFREWPWRIPDEVVRSIAVKRPPDHVFEEFRKLHGLEERR